MLDPLGGSYYVEALTNDMERAIWEVMEKRMIWAGPWVQSSRLLPAGDSRLRV